MCPCTKRFAVWKIEWCISDCILDSILKYMTTFTHIYWLMIYSNKNIVGFKLLLNGKLIFTKDWFLIFFFGNHFTCFAFVWAYSHIQSRSTRLFLKKEAKERKILSRYWSGNDFGVPKMWTLQTQELLTYVGYNQRTPEFAHSKLMTEKLLWASGEQT